jgi:hypothetical protein
MMTMEYVKDGSPLQTLDLYTPLHTDGLWLIFIHGGAW